MATATIKNPYTWGTGRRKTAVARVRIREGSGQFVVNDLPIDEYFLVDEQRNEARAPLRATDMGGRVDVFVNVRGSGKPSQAEAIIMGLARALKEFRADLEPALREGEFLSRDPRKVERKKYGHKKARKSFQFSKR
jgi:small subunit ribosomal protein S9